MEKFNNIIHNDTGNLMLKSSANVVRSGQNKEHENAAGQREGVRDRQ